MQVGPKFRPGDKCIVRDNMNRPKLWYLRNDERDLKGKIVTIRKVGPEAGYKGEAYDYGIEEDDWGFVGENDLELIHTVESATLEGAVDNVDFSRLVMGQERIFNQEANTPEKPVEVIFNPVQIQETALWLELHGRAREDYNELSAAIYEDMQSMAEDSRIDHAARLGYRIIKEEFLDSDTDRVVKFDVLVDMNAAEQTLHLQGTFDKDGNLVVKFPHDL